MEDDLPYLSILASLKFTRPILCTLVISAIRKHAHVHMQITNRSETPHECYFDKTYLSIKCNGNSCLGNLLDSSKHAVLAAFAIYSRYLGNLIRDTKDDVKAVLGLRIYHKLYSDICSSSS